MIEIGSSDAPVVLGVSSFKTPWRLWAELVGLLPKVDEPDEVMQAGKRLEDYVLDMQLNEEGHPDYSAVARQETVHHQDRKWQRATPDGIGSDEVGRTVFYEVKCLVGQPPPAPRVADVVQCLHQLLVFEDAEHVRLVYFGGLRRERFIIPRHQGAMDAVLRAEEHFRELVEKETPPPVRAQDASALWRAWPLVADRCERLTDEALAWDRMAVEAGAELEDARERYETARARIKAAMGDATQAVLPDGTRYTWRPAVNGVRTLRRIGAHAYTPGSGDQ